MTSVPEAHKNAAIAPLPYENEDAMREAVENFSTYLAILREWDERERQELDAKAPPWLVDLKPDEEV